MQEKDPYTYDKVNPRLVTNCARPDKTYVYAAGLWAASMLYYQRQVFRYDKNVAFFGLFALGSAFASYSYANYFTVDAVTEAGMLNNELEKRK